MLRGWLLVIDGIVSAPLSKGRRHGGWMGPATLLKRKHGEGFPAVASEPAFYTTTHYAQLAWVGQLLLLDAADSWGTQHVAVSVLFCLSVCAGHILGKACKVRW